jgi:hypothetical protein
VLNADRIIEEEKGPNCQVELELDVGEDSRLQLLVLVHDNEERDQPLGEAGPLAGKAPLVVEHAGALVGIAQEDVIFGRLLIYSDDLGAAFAPSSLLL